VEYRHSLPWRLGFVLFGGLGEVIPDDTQRFGSSAFLPAAGAGARFQLSTRYHLNLRADTAWGRDSRTWTLGIGEAF